MVAVDETVAEEPVVDEQERRSRLGWALAPLIDAAIFLASRLVVLAGLYTETVLRPGGVPLKSVVYMWDAAWYIHAADAGYPHVVAHSAAENGQSTIAFFPLFPLMVRVLQRVTHWDILLCGVLVSIVTGTIAAVLVGLLVRHLSNREASHRAVALFCFFPASVAMFMPFAEGVAVAFSAACLYFLIRRQWLWAGVAAGFATAARPTAMLLPVVCAVAAGAAILQRREWRSLIAPVLAPTGVLAYFTFLKFRTGSFNAWFLAEKYGWGQKTDWLSTWHAIQTVKRAPMYDLNALCAVIALGITIGGLVALFYWRPPMVVTVYAVLITLMALTSGTGSRVRYMLSAFPVIIAPAVVLKKGPAFMVVLGGYATLLGVFTILSTSFVQVIL